MSSNYDDLMWFMSFYRFVCIVNHPKSGRKLECYSNQPGVQFYTGNVNNKINVVIVSIGTILVVMIYTWKYG